jgi:RNA polymerase sigma factor for flagellar operon FliA
MSVASAYALAGHASPESLVEAHAPLVKRIAAHLLGRLPEGIELDDLVQVGLIALLEAARHYTPSKGASFETYASIRIRGAMLDEVRSSDWAPRSVYRKQRQLSAAIRAVENRKGEHATARDIAAELGVSLDEYHRLVSTTSHSRMFSLEQAIPDGEAAQRGEAGVQNDPVQALESEEFQQQMVRAIKSLPEREALVMSLYYDNELNLKEIGKVLGVSESRICQIHGQALARLRARLHEWTEGPGKSA